MRTSKARALSTVAAAAAVFSIGAALLQSPAPASAQIRIPGPSVTWKPRATLPVSTAVCTFAGDIGFDVWIAETPPPDQPPPTTPITTLVLPGNARYRYLTEYTVGGRLTSRTDWTTEGNAGGVNGLTTTYIPGLANGEFPVNCTDYSTTLKATVYRIDRWGQQTVAHSATRTVTVKLPYGNSIYRETNANGDETMVQNFANFTGQVLMKSYVANTKLTFP